MHEECIRRIKEVAGKIAITDDDLRDIEKHVSQALGELSTDQSFKSLSTFDKTKMASIKAKELHLQGRQEFAETTARVMNAPPDKQFETFMRSLHSEHFSSLEGAIEGVKGEERKAFKEFLKLGSKWGGFANDPEVMNKVYKAIRGIETDDPAVNAFAKQYNKLLRTKVQQARELGLDIHEIEHYSSQPHDHVKIGMVSAEDFVRLTKQRIDLKVYERKGLEGKDLDNFLKEAYFTLTSKGGNKVIESLGKTTTRSPRVGGSRNNPRQLHFTPEGYSEHMQQFGANITPSEFISRTLDNLIRDMEVVRRFGVNAHENFNWLLEVVKENQRNYMREKLKGKGERKWRSAHDNIEKQAKDAKNYWDRLTISRELLPEEMSSNQKLIRDGQSLMITYDVARAFGTQVFETIPEIIRTIVLGSPRVSIPMSEKLKEISKLTTDAQYRSFVKNLTPSYEHAISGMMNEVKGSLDTQVKTIANAAVKWQGLKAMDTFHTTFVSSFLMRNMGDISKDFKSLKSLKQKFGKETYKTLVQDYGFTETDFHMLSQVDRMGESHITAEGIRNLKSSVVGGFAQSEGKSVELLKDNLASKFNAYIWGMTQEHARGSMHSTLQDTKLLSSRGGHPEFRFVTEFVVTAMSVMRQHLFTVPSLLEGGHLGVSANVYRAKFIAIGMILHNILADTCKRLIKGEEPPDYNDPTTYVDAFLGAIPFYHRFFPKIGGSALESPATAFRGVVGFGGYNIYDFFKTGLTALTADENKPEKRDKEIDSFTKHLSKQVPLQNLWQVQLLQSVFQYNILDNVFDFFNEGYKERLEIRKEQNRLQYGK